MIAEYPPALPVMFSATCARHPDYEGRPRTSNLAALADFDRHAAQHRAMPAIDPEARVEDKDEEEEWL